MKPERKEQVEKVFAKADKDSSGTLCIKEFMEAMQELAENESDREQCKNQGVCEMIMDAVGDDNKAVTLEELMVIINEVIDDGKMIRTLVKNADKDGDGLICADELKSMMMKMDPENEDIDVIVNMMLRICCHDSNRKIKPEELISFFEDGPKENNPKEDAKRMFRMFDTNADGYVDKNEIAAYLKDMIELDDDDDESYFDETAKMMLASADWDEDGKLNYEEFCIMMENQQI